MSKPKKILSVFTLGVLIVLIACTVLSKHIASSIQPEVEVIKPVRMGISVDGAKPEIYDTVIPCNAVIPIDLKNYVYTVEQRQGLFGSEYYAKFVEVGIVAGNDLYAAIGGWVITGFDDIVLSSSKQLNPDETVKVINK